MRGCAISSPAGFFRYTVDPSWQVPHFEKMLYTQALLVRGVPACSTAVRARRTMRRWRAIPSNSRCARCAAPRAHSSPVSRRSTVRVKRVASTCGRSISFMPCSGEEDTALARRYWRMQDIPALDGGHLPRRGEDIARIAQLTGQDEALLKTRIEAIRTKLLAARATRVLPADRKELAGWNGLMLAAFAAGAMEWDDPRLRAAATRVRDHLRNRLWDGQQLRRALSGERELGNASLEDYAYVAYGMARYADAQRRPGRPDLCRRAAALRLAALLRCGRLAYGRPTADTGHGRGAGDAGRRPARALGGRHPPVAAER